MDSDHTIESCYETTEKVLHIVFNQLYAQRVAFELMILKPNMVVPGKECPKQADVAQVAEATVTCLLRAVPAAVCGVAFLSGGQSSARASAHLNAMNARYASRLPWPLTFSYARAIQQPALQIWKGLDVNVKDAQEALLYRAKCNSAARQASIVMRWNMMKRLRLVLRVYIHTWVVRTRKAMNILEIEWREDKEGSRRFSAPTGSRVQAKGLSPETAQSLARASIGLI